MLIKFTSILTSLFLLFYSFLSFAEDETPPERLKSPAEVIAEAQKGEHEYVRVLGEVERFVPYMSEPAELYSYLLILDQLDQIRKKINPDPMFGDSLAIVAKVITEHSVKFINLVSDPYNIIETFFRWSLDFARNSALDEQIYYIGQLQDKENLLKWLVTSEKLFNLLKDLKSIHYVFSNLGSLQVRVVRKLMTPKYDLSREETLELFKHLRSEIILQELLGDFQNRAYKSQKSDEHIYFIKIALIAHQSLKQLNDNLFASLEAFPKQNILLSLRFLLHHGDEIPEALAAPIAEAFDHHLIFELTELIKTSTKNYIADSQLLFLVSLYDHIKGWSKKWLTNTEQIQFRQTYSRFLVKKMGLKNLEGIFEIEVKGSKTALTIASLGNSELIANIGESEIENDVRTMALSFFDLEFDPVKNVFVGTRYNLDQTDRNAPDISNYYLEFGYDLKASEVKGYFRYAQNKYLFKGKRISQFKSLETQKLVEKSNNNSNSLDSLIGKYKGDDVNGMQLSIGSKGDSLIGEIFMDKQKILISTPFVFYGPNKNYLYLTSSEFQSMGRWFQLRAERVSEDQWVAEFIIGGKKSLTKNIKLTKMESSNENAYSNINGISFTDFVNSVGF